MTFCEEYLLYKSNQMQCSGIFDDTPSAYLKFGKLYKKNKKKKKKMMMKQYEKGRIDCVVAMGTRHSATVSYYQFIRR